MFKTLTKTLVILLLPSTLLAANIDSLQSALNDPSTHTETKLELYFELGKASYSQYDYATAQQHLEAGLDLAREVGDNRHEFRFSSELGYTYYWLDDYPSAIGWLQKADSKRDGVPNREVGSNLARLSEAYLSGGQYAEALDRQLKALEIFEILGDSLGIANSLRLLGTIHWYKQEPDESLEYTRRALSIFERIEGHKSMYTCLAAISSIFMEKEAYQTSLSYAQRSLKLAREIDYTYGIAFSQGMVGSIQKEIGEYEKAFDNIKSALDVFDELQVKYEAIEFSTMLADLYARRGEIPEALHLHQENLTLADEIQSLSLKRDINQAIAETYELAGDSALALSYYKAYSTYKDSLVNQEVLAQMDELEQKYMAEEQARQIQTLRNQNQTFYIYAATAGIVFLLLIVWLFYLRFKTQNRINELLSVKNREIAERNDRLASSNAELRQFADIISKDLKEPLRQIGHTANELEQEAVMTDAVGVSSLASNILKSVNRMDTLLADLSAYSVEGFDEEPYEAFDVREVVYQIISDLPAELHAQGVKIRVRNLPLVNANKRQISLVFRNLIENALKFRKENEPEVIIDCEVKRRYFRFHVADNGIGIPIKEQKAVFSAFKRLRKGVSPLHGTGMGLAICKKIIELHNGKIWVHSQPDAGSTFYFTLPR